MQERRVSHDSKKREARRHGSEHGAENKQSHVGLLAQPFMGCTALWALDESLADDIATPTTIDIELMS